MKTNPFKFGTVVDDEYFTNRTEEIKKIKSILASENHLILISPRRYGKTSLVKKVTSEIKRPIIFLDLQLVTTIEDFTSHLLQKTLNQFPYEKAKQFIKNFRVIPNLSLNPVSNDIDISFNPIQSSQSVLEDVFNLIEKLSSKKNKIIVVFDEFQEINKIEKNLDKKLRAVLQHQKMVNYVMMGSQESLMREIFEKKKSPFYHFGFLIQLNRIPETDFLQFLISRFNMILKDSTKLCKSIIEFTNLHPYYTQQLAFNVWDNLQNKKAVEIKEVIQQSVVMHDNDYERLWGLLNKTEMKIMIALASAEKSPMTDEIRMQYQLGATSTVFSSIKKLIEKGFVIQINKIYEIEDPFFKEWILMRRRN
ncbi:MAG: ATP-binding protein [Ignavibacteriales bacterium]|nr:ATP-binding protein [Ignavibacteriales bacterium]